MREVRWRRFSRTGGIIALLKIVQWPVAIALALLAFALLHYFAPDIKDQQWHWITPCATADLILWLAISIGFKAYLDYFDTYSRTYGSLGAVAAVLVGTELNSVIEYAAAQKGAHDAKLRRKSSRRG